MITDLFPRSASGFKLGLDQMRALLDELGAPDRDYPCALVAGTNGKGSTCAALADVLQKDGRRVGLYTSPHLLRFAERFRINGIPVADTKLVQSYDRVRRADAQRVRKATGDARAATFFELGTALALLSFSAEDVDFAVLEVGLGGRLDATNAVDRVLSVITPIGLDHQHYLGETLTEIAGEKAGIIRPGVPLVVTPQTPEADEALQRVAANNAVESIPVVVDRRPGARRPPALAVAAATAATAAEVLECSAGAIDSMLFDTRWHPAARYQWCETHAKNDVRVAVLLDAAHNPMALEALIKTLKDDEKVRGRAVHAVFNVLNDRPLHALAKTLRPVVRSLHVPSLPTPRSADPRDVPKELATHHSEVGPALGAAIEAASQDDGIVLVAGSFQLLAEVLHRLLGTPRDPPVRG